MSAQIGSFITSSGMTTDGKYHDLLSAMARDWIKQSGRPAGLSCARILDAGGVIHAIRVVYLGVGVERN